MLRKLTLPRSTLSVSALCFGTNMFGTAADQAKADALLDRFAALGGNFIDTARSYGDWVPNAPVGASERAVGAWLSRQDRRDFVIATKGGFMDLRAGTWQPRVTPEAIAQDLAESLDHLQIDRIDLYWLHTDDPSKPVGPIVDALIGHQKAGRISSFGASNWMPPRIAEAQAHASALGHPGFVAIQPFWGLAVPNRDVAAQNGYGFYYEDGLQALHAAGLPIIPYSSQSRGYFSKLDKGGTAGLPEALQAMYGNAVNERRFEAAQRVAARHATSVNDVALAYLASQTALTIPIIGASSPAQIDESVRALALHLSPSEIEELRIAD